MLYKGQNYKTAFILGAGATRGAVKHKRIKAPLNNDFFKVSESFVRAQGSKILRNQFDSLKKIFSDEIPLRSLPQMEEAFNILYISKDFPKIFRRARGRLRTFGSRAEIEIFLKLIFSILTTIENKLDNQTLYDELVKHLVDRDTLITLNYDTLLDSALVSQGWNYKKGYCIGGMNNKFSGYPKRSTFNNSLNSVKLLKLHGSINWYVRGTYDNISKVFSSKPVKIKYKRYKKERKGYIRQIIPPVYGKMFENPHWQQIWDEGFRSLIDAEVVVVIGCSLADADFHFRSFLYKVVSERKRKGNSLKKIVLVDKVTIRNKWRSIFKGCFKNKKNVKEFKSFEMFMQSLK
ncbi:MAG: SIR2 family protein [Planctomycetes bacterium]|nr:SIR2 family protein [Planctomycetota bacterium]